MPTQSVDAPSSPAFRLYASTFPP